jgi:hypothetical protein
MRHLLTAAVLFALPLAVEAASCGQILSKFPNHPPESSVFAKQVDDYIKGCKTRPGSEDPTKLNNCIVAGMRSLAVAGNYVAVEHMAVQECNNGNEEVSKNWLGMIIKNNHASDYERAIANEVVNGSGQ